MLLGDVSGGSKRGSRDFIPAQLMIFTVITLTLQYVYTHYVAQHYD